MLLKQQPFIYLLVSSLALLRTISCKSPSECYYSGQEYCLTVSGSCTYYYSQCSETCSSNSDCFFECCSDGYCQYGTACSSSGGFPAIAIILPIVFISVFIVFAVVCSVIARRRAAQRRVEIMDQQMKLQANLGMMMQGANMNNNNVANQVQFNQMQNMLLQQQLMQQQTGLTPNGVPLQMQMMQANQYPSSFSYQQQQPQQPFLMTNQVQSNNGVVSYI